MECNCFIPLPSSQYDLFPDSIIPLAYNGKRNSSVIIS